MIKHLARIIEEGHWNINIHKRTYSHQYTHVDEASRASRNRRDMDNIIKILLGVLQTLKKNGTHLGLEVVDQKDVFKNLLTQRKDEHYSINYFSMIINLH